jgi:hypothetical protein
MCDSSSLEEEKYWVTFTFHDHGSKNFKLTNVSSDFIKGIYCGLLQPSDKYENKLDIPNYDMTIETNYVLTDCLDPNIIDSSDYGILFECQFNESIGYEPNNSERSNILCDPNRYNTEWGKYIVSNDFLPKIPLTKRYIVFIHIGDVDFDEDEDFIIQFDTIDFLNGFEMVRLWIDDNYFNDTNYLSSRSIFDSGKVCKKYVEYDIKKSAKVQSDLSYIIECLIEFFPKELAQIIVHEHVYECVLERNCKDLSEQNYDEYDVCTTQCIGNVCHIHSKSRKKLSLQECLVEISLEQL